MCWRGVGGGLAFSTPLSDFGCWRMGVVTSLARRLLSGKGNSPHKRTAGVAARPWSHPPQQLEDGCSSLAERPGPGVGGGHGVGGSTGICSDVCRAGCLMEDGVGSRRELWAGGFLEEEVILGHLEEQLRRQTSKERSKGSMCANVVEARALSGNTELFKNHTGHRGGQRPDHEGSCVPLSKTGD